jgi:hypothetical protein
LHISFAETALLALAVKTYFMNENLLVVVTMPHVLALNKTAVI